MIHRRALSRTPPNADVHNAPLTDTLGREGAADQGRRTNDDGRYGRRERRFRTTGGRGVHHPHQRACDLSDYHHDAPVTEAAATPPAVPPSTPPAPAVTPERLPIFRPPVCKFTGLFPLLLVPLAAGFARIRAHGNDQVGRAIYHGSDAYEPDRLEANETHGRRQGNSAPVTAQDEIPRDHVAGIRRLGQGQEAHQAAVREAGNVLRDRRLVQ